MEIKSDIEINGFIYNFQGEAVLEQMDEGIGAHEFWGSPSNHVKPVWRVVDWDGFEVEAVDGGPVNGDIEEICMEKAKEIAEEEMRG